MTISFVENMQSSVNKLDAQRVLRHVPIMPYHDVADIGAGDGHLTIPIAKYSYDGKIVAMDPDKVKIASLREAVKAARLSNVLTRSITAGKRLPPKKESVDGVVLSRVLHHVDDPGHLLREAKRILRDGGWAAVIELHKRADVEGHPLEERLAEEDAKSMLDEEGFRLRSRYDLGRYYMFVLRK